MGLNCLSLTSAHGGLAQSVSQAASTREVVKEVRESGLRTSGPPVCWAQEEQRQRPEASACPVCLMKSMKAGGPGGKEAIGDRGLSGADPGLLGG